MDPSLASQSAPATIRDRIALLQSSASQPPPKSDHDLPVTSDGQPTVTNQGSSLLKGRQTSSGPPTPKPRRARNAATAPATVTTTVVTTDAHGRVEPGRSRSAKLVTPRRAVIRNRRPPSRWVQDLASRSQSTQATYQAHESKSAESWGSFVSGGSSDPDPPNSTAVTRSKSSGSTLCVRPAPFPPLPHSRPTVPEKREATSAVSDAASFCRPTEVAVEERSRFHQHNVSDTISFNAANQAPSCSINGRQGSEASQHFQSLMGRAQTSGRANPSKPPQWTVHAASKPGKSTGNEAASSRVPIRVPDKRPPLPPKSLKPQSSSQSDLVSDTPKAAPSAGSSFQALSLLDPKAGKQQFPQRRSLQTPEGPSALIIPENKPAPSRVPLKKVYSIDSGEFLRSGNRVPPFPVDGSVHWSGVPVSAGEEAVTRASGERKNFQRARMQFSGLSEARKPPGNSRLPLTGIQGQQESIRARQGPSVSVTAEVATTDKAGDLHNTLARRKQGSPGLRDNATYSRSRTSTVPTARVVISTPPKAPPPLPARVPSVSPYSQLQNSLLQIGLDPPVKPKPRPSGVGLGYHSTSPSGSEMEISTEQLLKSSAHSMVPSHRGTDSHTSVSLPASPRNSSFFPPQVPKPISLGPSLRNSPQLTPATRGSKDLPPGGPVKPTLPPRSSQKRESQDLHIDGHVVPKDARARYEALFERADSRKEGFLLPEIVRSIFVLSRLDKEVLAEIWEKAIANGRRGLGRDRFSYGMWLIDEQLRRGHSSLQRPLLLGP